MAVNAFRAVMPMDVDWFEMVQTSLQMLFPDMTEELISSLRQPGPPFPVWAQVTQNSPPRTGVWRMFSVWLEGNSSAASTMVGRSFFNGILVPAQIAFDLKVARVCSESQLYLLHNFEVLLILRGQAEWVEAANGDVPPNAVAVGMTADGEEIPMVRVMIEDPQLTYRMGQLVRDKGIRCLTARGDIILSEKYEVLVISGN